MPLVPAPQVTGSDDDYLNLKDFMGSILVALPTSKDTVTTQQFGERDVVRADFYKWNETSFDDLGELTVFWARMRKQLDSFVGTGQGVVGKLMPAGRSFALVDLEPALLAKVEKAWAELESF